MEEVQAAQGRRLRRRGYSVSWYPDGDNWIEVFLPDRFHASAPELRAYVKFYGHPSPNGIDGGMVTKLSIHETHSMLTERLFGRAKGQTRMLYNFDHGPEVDRLSESPEASRLYHAVVEELN